MCGLPCACYKPGRQGLRRKECRGREWISSRWAGWGPGQSAGSDGSRPALFCAQITERLDYLSADALIAFNLFFTLSRTTGLRSPAAATALGGAILLALLR